MGLSSVSPSIGGHEGLGSSWLGRWDLEVLLTSSSLADSLRPLGKSS